MTDEKKPEPISLPIPAGLAPRVRVAQVRFDKASREHLEALKVATEGGAKSGEVRQKAIATAIAALDEFEAARALLSGVEEECVVALEQTPGADASKQRASWTRDVEGARRYVREERARLDALAIALKDLKGPVGAA